MENKEIYKVVFRNQDKIYEIHASDVQQSNLFGFIEIHGMIFGDKSELLIDPAEEKLRSEFANVDFSYIPMHAVIRIDKVSKQGSNKIVEGVANNNVTPFPGAPFPPQKKND